jgi:hypothetical protein
MEHCCFQQPEQVAGIDKRAGELFCAEGISLSRMLTQEFH